MHTRLTYSTCILSYILDMQTEYSYSTCSKNKHILDMQIFAHILDMQIMEYILDMQITCQHTRHAQNLKTYSTCTLEADIYSTNKTRIYNQDFGNHFENISSARIWYNHLIILLSIQVHEFLHSRTPIKLSEHKNIRVIHKNH